jgi:tetratricopeptide (TPR) repeat protein
VPDKTVHFAEVAGDRALALLASDRARDHYIVTLEALGSMGLDTQAQRRRWCLVAQKLGNSCVFDPLAVREHLPLFRRAVKLAHELQDHDLIARAEYWLGYIDYGRGQPASAIRHCEAALYSAQTSGEPRLIAQIQATLGQALAQAGRYARARPLLAQAIDLKRQQSHVGSRVAIGSAYTLSRTAYVLGDLGHFDEAHAHFEQALAMMGGELHPVGGSIYTTVSAVHLWQGRWHAAAQAAQQGVDIALRCRSHYLVAMGRALLGCALWAEGGDTAVLRGLRQTCRDMELGGGAAWMSLIYGWLVEGHCALGDPVHARSEAARLLMRARVEDRHGLAMGCRALARHAIGQGELAAAARYLNRADESASWRGSPREASLNAQVRAQLLRAQGSLGEAEAMDRAARDELRRMGVQAVPGFTLQASVA